MRPETPFNPQYPAEVGRCLKRVRALLGLLRRRDLSPHARESLERRCGAAIRELRAAERASLAPR